MNEFLTTLKSAFDAIEVEPFGFSAAVGLAKAARNRSRVYFIGNGGSAAIASHMATDFFNKARFAATAFNDASSMSAIANDFGYRFVFDFQLMRIAKPGDVLFAISSSGKSSNITEAVKNSSRILDVVTLSGFEPDNPLRALGTINFYVPSKSYPIVENVHMAILHAMLEDLAK